MSGYNQDQGTSLQLLCEVASTVGADTWITLKTATFKIQTCVNKCLHQSLSGVHYQTKTVEMDWPHPAEGNLQHHQTQALTWNPQGKRKHADLKTPVAVTLRPTTRRQDTQGSWNTWHRTGVLGGPSLAASAPTGVISDSSSSSSLMVRITPNLCSSG